MYPGEAEDAEAARLLDASASDMFHASVGEVVQLLQLLMKDVSTRSAAAHAQGNGAVAAAACGNGGGPRAAGLSNGITFPAPQLQGQPVQWPSSIVR
jgi:hypothetical protein